ncbi:hypothetical protein CC1G_10921 [Coprinopsis cinerea okayama7|uniref:Zinc finger PHD-type domain-containing protein n=1 Tax=Coprinopsis cinerea (strain Okayama-7 / 130 / ATCC MYA-4618 / FGSC 9003) TaxID=240176 RepID=A8NT23_COPC7|nr:hypothetical protein CC1G_10921 [Coprinopsis cinerea okayama7\|eukprot:XP_001836140.2 hypothetical protein CC1G_10921 [Coprinopsis cinerea okayama7\
MPRRSTRQIASAQQEQVPEQPLQQQLQGPDANLFNLRRHWKWAAVTQFYYIFADLFATNDVSITDIENDFIHGTDVFLPRIMQRLLVTLSYDRKITLDNWQNALRKQYDRRDPDANPLGPPTATAATNSRLSSVLKEEEPEKPSSETGDAKDEDDKQPNGTDPSEGPSSRQQTEDPPTRPIAEEEDTEKNIKPTVDWSELDMLQKLETLHTLIEWQFQNPLRLRSIMKSDDEFASWRTEPIGYDRTQNAYWLIGGNRLWIQRVPPKPPAKKKKRKEAPAVGQKRKAATKEAAAKQKTAKRRKTRAEPAPSTPTATPRGSRAAKEQAKAKLDAQAKALAEYQRQTASQTRSTRSTRNSKPAPPPPPPTRGTRTSSRLRNLQDDGWQQVPDEWLEPQSSPSKGKKTGLEGDDDSISDLTELSDDEEEEEEEEQEESEEEPEEPKERTPTPEPEPEPQQDFVEWETLCVTLAEWEAFPEQFAKSTHYLERSFYKYLTTVVVPEVTAELKAIEQKRRLEEALSHRKRSSRLAQRESEKEAARIAAQKKAEEDAQMARTRRLEARLKREQEEREKKERAREERRANREARVLRRGESAAKSEKDEEEHHSTEDEKLPTKSKPKANGKAKSPARNSKASGARTPGSESDWELDCEICGRRGKNIDDGKPMMCCGHCSKWQHISCHDKMDASQGRPKRDWDKIEFLCRRCLAQRHPPRATAALGQIHQPATGVYAYPSQGRWQNGTSTAYIDSRNHISYGAHPDSYARSAIGQTSSVRSSAAGGYTTQSVYGAHPNQPSNMISFSHYQPQERAFTSDPNRSQVPPQHSNPYMRTNGTNGSWPVDPMKYPHYAGQSSWGPNYANPSVPSHHVAGHSAHGSSLPSSSHSHQVDMSYYRSTAYDQRPPPHASSAAPPPHAASHSHREAYQQYPTSSSYPPAPPSHSPSHPSSLPPVQQPQYSHTRTPYPPQS